MINRIAQMLDQRKQPLCVLLLGGLSSEFMPIFILRMERLRMERE